MTSQWQRQHVDGGPPAREAGVQYRTVIQNPPKREPMPTPPVVGMASYRSQLRTSFSPLGLP